MTFASIDAPTVFTAAKSDEKPGTVKALVSAYGVKYRIGYARWHTIEAGAFADSIAAQGTIPLFWQHSWQYTEQAPIGHGAASESDAGLEIDGELYVAEDPTVARLHMAMVNKAIREWSIGYRVIAQRVDPDDDTHFFVTEGELLEASSVLRGANPATETLKVASLVLGREPTADELALLSAGKPLSGTDPQPDPAPTRVASDLWDRMETVRRLLA